MDLDSSRTLHATLATLSPRSTPAQPQADGQAMRPSIDALNRLLRHEIASMQAYLRASHQADRTLAGPLLITLAGHQRRADVLRDRLLNLHGLPVDSAGDWGVREYLVEGTAAKLGPRMMLVTLEAMEGRGVADYRRERTHLDALSRGQVEADLLPEQEVALAAMTALRLSSSTPLPATPLPVATPGAVA